MNTALLSSVAVTSLLAVACTGSTAASSSASSPRPEAAEHAYADTEAAETQAADSTPAATSSADAAELGTDQAAAEGSAAPPEAQATEVQPSDETSAQAASAEQDKGWADETEASPVAESKPTPSDSEGETRTQAVIVQYVSDHRWSVRECVNKEQHEDPSLGGDLVLRFVISDSGRVTRLSVNEEQTTFKSESATECILSLVKNWQFPSSSRGMETKVNYPFTFNPRKKS